MLTTKRSMYDKLGPRVAEALKTRHFAADYYPTAEEAKAAILSEIAPEASVGWGGSVTVDGLGIKDELRARGQKLFDRDKAPDRAASTLESKKALTADVFLMSSNAISQDGCLVNMDGMGTRLAALVFGPDKVLVVAGMNKVCSTVESAVDRVRNIAAPMNCQRFAGESPCRVTGACGSCKSPDSICANLVITRLCKVPGRIHVILIGEDLGM